MEDRFDNVPAGDDFELEEELVDKSYMFLSIPLRLLILLGGTVLISALYRGIIETGIFKLIHGTAMLRLVYCIFELLLLGGFWHCVFMFSKKCKHCSHSLGAHYLMICIVAVAYTGICCVLYHFLSREMYSWLLRITLNLCGFRFQTSFPDNLTPYLIAYLIITILIMLLEPIIAQRRFKRFVRKTKGIPNPLEIEVQALLDSIAKRRYEKAMRREMEMKRQKMLEKSERESADENKRT